MKINLFVLKDQQSLCATYLRGYNPYTREDEWTSFIKRAMFFFEHDVAETQATNLALKGMDYWEVVQVEIDV